jgi:D-alanyl-D-alanine carboxypeptidase/D-alanyl-D-alanine-endopeptidase (penicillin-binding protein 4)
MIFHYPVQCLPQIIFENDMRQYPFNFLFTFLGVMLSGHSFAQSADAINIAAPEIVVSSPINHSVSQNDFLNALSQDIARSNVSFYAQAIGASEPIIAINANRAQNPASVIKLVTTFVALKKFGADYRWQTSLLAREPINAQGQLNSPLLLKGSGDPQLVVERLDDLVQQLKRAGLKQLNAPLLIDRNAFAYEAQNPAEFDGEPAMPYNALPDAALMNYHALSFSFDPAHQQVRMVPWLDGFDLSNHVRFIEGACPANGWKSTINLGVSGYSASLSGTYYSGCGAQQWHVHAYQLSANQYAQGVLGALFKGHTGLESSSCGVERFWDQLFQRWHDCFAPIIAWSEPQAMDAVSSSRMPNKLDLDESWRVLAMVESPPLSAMIKDMNFYSNNVMARQIYLNLSLQPHKAANLSSSAQEVHHILKAAGLNDDSIRMGNGSGLSNETRISPRELAQVLIQANQMPEFVDSLPRIGMEGTVKKRLTDTDMVGRGHMKTGSLNNVRAIAGYIDGKSGTRYIVVSLINDANAQSESGKRAHDLFMRWVGEQ